MRFFPIRTKFKRKIMTFVANETKTKHIQPNSSRNTAILLGKYFHIYHMGHLRHVCLNSFDLTSVNNSNGTCIRCPSMEINELRHLCVCLCWIQHMYRQLNPSDIGFLWIFAWCQQLAQANNEENIKDPHSLPGQVPSTYKGLIMRKTSSISFCHHNWISMCLNHASTLKRHKALTIIWRTTMY